MPKIQGLDKLIRNIRAGQRADGQAIEAAVYDALTVLRDETNTLAPRSALRGGAVIAKRGAGSRFQRLFWVAFRRGIPMRIAHLVELGTAPHSLAKGASRRKGLLQNVPPFHPGTRPEPFFRPAFENTKSEVVSRFGRNVFNLVLASIRGTGK